MALRANARVEDSTDYWGNTDHTYPTFSPIEAHGLRCIFKRKWFTRMWCLQECALVPKQVCFIGRMTTSFQKLIVTEQARRKGKWLGARSITAK